MLIIDDLENKLCMYSVLFVVNLFGRMSMAVALVSNLYLLVQVLLQFTLFTLENAFSNISTVTS